MRRALRRFGRSAARSSGATAAAAPSADGPRLGLNTPSNLFGNQVLFGDTVVGESNTFLPALITVQNFANLGPNSGAHITGITLTGDFTQTNNCPVPPATLAGQASCTIRVFFAPKAVGQRTGTLTIMTDAPGNVSFTVNFAGNGVLTPGVSLVPTSLNFAKQAAGQTSAALTATLTNTGNGTLTLGNVNVSGPFMQTNNCGVSLAAGASCQFSIKFAPAASGPANSLLSFTANAAGGLFAIGLRGTGVTGPAAQAQPSSLTFGNQPVGTISAPKAVTFSNPGDAPLSIAGVVASENFKQTNNCPSSLGPGASCTINISFAPTTDTFTTVNFPTNGDVFVSHSTQGSPFAVRLTGFAITSTLAATTVVTSSQNPSTVGQAVTFTATVTSSTAGTPAGTVTFFDGAAQLGTGTLNAQKQATFTTSSLAQGNHSITAQYRGDANFSSSTSAPLTQTVNSTSKANTTTAFSSLPNPSTFGQAVTFTASVTSTSAGTPTGSVTFLDNGSSIGTGTLDAQAKATFTTSSLTVGAHPITAQYGGDSNFNGSASAAVTQQVNAPPADFTVNASPASLNITAGQSGTVTFTVTPQNGSTRTVTFSCGNLPEKTTCSFTPPSVTLDGMHAASSTATIQTTANSAIPIARRSMPLLPNVRWIVLTGVFTLFLLGLSGLAQRGSRRGAFACLLLIGAVLAIAACGGSNPSNPTGTPPGAYNVSLTGTAGATSHSITVTVTVK